MGFENFWAAISSDRLRCVARQWHVARLKSGGRMPAWADIDLGALEAEADLLWSYDYDNRKRRFTGRFAGQKIAEVFRAPFRGTDMQRLVPAPDYQRIHERHERIISEPCIFHGRGLVFGHLERAGWGERVILPVANGGGAGGGTGGNIGDGIFGATVYELIPRTGIGASRVDGEQETFYPLD